MGLKLNQKITVLLGCIILSCAVPESLKERAPDRQNTLTIYVTNHGWHTGISLRASDAGRRLEYLKKYFPDAAYYEFGWGDADFYQAQVETVGLALKAAFWPTKSVMHVAARDAPPGGDTISLRVTPNGFEALLKTISESFLKEKNDEIVRLREGLYYNSYFFAGREKYYLTKTCNTWTARSLKAAGLPLRVFLTLTAGSVMSQLRKIKSKLKPE